MSRLDGRVAVVTGGSRGIGAAFGHSSTRAPWWRSTAAPLSLALR